MAPKGYTLATIADFVGKELGASDWITVDQRRIDDFAACTGDHQWIHVDVERAKRESPFGTTIAHGYLTLSLLPRLSWDSIEITQPMAMSVNYGSDKVRFMSPVPAGSRIRNRVKLLTVKDIEGGWQ